MSNEKKKMLMSSIFNRICELTKNKEYFNHICNHPDLGKEKKNIELKSCREDRSFIIERLVEDFEDFINLTKEKK